MDAWTSMQLLPVPPIQQQYEIANFLETKTRRIDALRMPTATTLYCYRPVKA
ncbi:restriction endonuclease S subunit [Paraburkholderia sp. MM5496-R1]